MLQFLIVLAAVLSQGVDVFGDGSSGKGEDEGS